MTSRLLLALALAVVVAACASPTPSALQPSGPAVAPTPTPSLDAYGAYEGDPCATVRDAVVEHFAPSGATATLSRAGTAPTLANTCEVTITRDDGSTWTFTVQVVEFPRTDQASAYFDASFVRKFGGAEANDLGDEGLISVDPVALEARVGARSGTWVITFADLNAERTGDPVADDTNINDSARAFIDLMKAIVPSLS